MSGNNGKQLDAIGHPKKGAFLAAYAECGNVSQACKLAEVGRSTHYVWINEDDEYQEAFRQAHQVAIESLESEARRRAVEGWDEPVFHEGAVCGHKRKFSDTLLIFLLKAADPEKYRERIEQRHTGGIEHSIVTVYLPENRRNLIEQQPHENGSSNGKH